MKDYIQLLGAEEVTRAGHNIASAASSMQSTANYISEIFERHERFLTQWLSEIRDLLEKK